MSGTGRRGSPAANSSSPTWPAPDLEGIHQLRLVIEELRTRATGLLRISLGGLRAGHRGPGPLTGLSRAPR
ncbi:hypothetical protein [Streptomyces sp. NPDC059788]|uniref:hypothetical protein n=1 Tax=Streptomyces sp. NPDC059788 TaxID=3346948 RepID=UPI00365CFCFA